MSTPADWRHVRLIEQDGCWSVVSFHSYMELGPIARKALGIAGEASRLTRERAMEVGLAAELKLRTRDSDRGTK